MDTRVCKVCGIAKPFDGINYHIKYGVPVGRVCRACLNLAQNVRRTDHAVRLATNLCSKLYWANNKKKRAEKITRGRKRIELRLQCGTQPGVQSSLTLPLNG